MSSNANLGYGLNARNKRKKGGLTGFGGDDSDSNDGDNDEAAGAAGGANARNDINREIAAEQAALRKRAEAAMASSAAADSAVYDYDAEYDSFSSGKKKEEAARSAKAAADEARDEPKGKVRPRYIANLMKTAERRNQEQEVIYERQVQKEQAEEDADRQFEGKDKFVTSSYKRKLAEREQWAKEEKERTKLEEANDVTKMKQGAGSFMFGGIGRSLLMGGGGGGRSDNQRRDGEAKGGLQTKSTDEKDGGDDSNRDVDVYQDRESSRETERWGSSKRCRDSREEYSHHRKQPTQYGGGGGSGNATSNTASNEKESAQNAVKTRQQILEDRAVKIREARERYFKRREGVVATQ